MSIDDLQHLLELKNFIDSSAGKAEELGLDDIRLKLDLLQDDIEYFILFGRVGCVEHLNYIPMPLSVVSDETFSTFYCDIQNKYKELINYDSCKSV